MFKLLDLLDPTSWAFRLVGALGMAALLWFGVINPYNNYVSEGKVESALQKERAEKQPILDELAKRVADRDATIKSKDDAFKLEHARQTEQAAAKQKLYNEVVKQNANLSKQIQNSIVAVDSLASQLRDITARSRVAGTSDSDYQRRLGDALASCETDLNRQLRTTEEAAAIAANALAAARALKTTP